MTKKQTKKRSSDQQKTLPRQIVIDRILAFSKVFKKKNKENKALENLKN